MMIGSKKIPAFIFVIIAGLLIIALSMPTIVLPYYNRVSEMDIRHQEVVTEINKYNNAIKSQKNIEDDIAELSKEIDDFSKKMKIDADSAVEELQNNVFTKFGVEDQMYSFTRSEETKTDKTTKSGTDLYYVQISIKLAVPSDKLLSVLNYIEQISTGYYYVHSVNCSTLTEDYKDDNNKTIAKKGDLDSTVTVLLYYIKD